jgi:hypothetical protein
VQPVDLSVEMQRMQQQLSSTLGRLEAATHANADLQRQLAEAARASQQPKPADPPPAPLISEKEREEYGDELIEFIGKVFEQKPAERLWCQDRGVGRPARPGRQQRAERAAGLAADCAGALHAEAGPADARLDGNQRRPEVY